MTAVCVGHSTMYYICYLVQSVYEPYQSMYSLFPEEDTEIHRSYLFEAQLLSDRTRTDLNQIPPFLLYCFKRHCCPLPLPSYVMKEKALIKK